MSPIVGAMSTPDREATIPPRIQATRRTRCASMPVISSRSGSSTTARMDVPVRVWPSTHVSTAAMATPTSTTISWAHDTKTPPTSNVDWGRYGGRVRVAAV